MRAALSQSVSRAQFQRGRFHNQPFSVAHRLPDLHGSLGTILRSEGARVTLTDRAVQHGVKNALDTFNAGVSRIVADHPLTFRELYAHEAELIAILHNRIDVESKKPERRLPPGAPVFYLYLHHIRSQPPGAHQVSGIEAGHLIDDDAVRAGGVDEFVVAHPDAHMRDGAPIGGEKDQVAGLELTIADAPSHGEERSGMMRDTQTLRNHCPHYQPGTIDPART